MIGEIVLIHIIDDYMGKGKTQGLIEKINNNRNNNYMYITPFLDEVQRIKKNCQYFYEPSVKYGQGRKLNDLHNLLRKELNIVSTHALFRNATEETEELIRLGKYVLILDEVMDVVEKVDLTKDDINTLLNEKLISIDSRGMVEWNEEKINYDARYNDIKNMAKNECLFLVNDIVLMWTFPIKIFNAFDEVWVATYLFEGQIQKYYYDLYKIEYEYYHIDEDWGICQGKSNEKPIDRKKINIINDKINNMGDNQYVFSATWFMKNKDNIEVMKKLKNNILNYFQNKVGASSKEILWTTFKSYKNKIQGKGYTKGFLAVNTRATNNYADRKYLAYVCNIFMNPLVKGFFINNGVGVDEDKYALGEVLQWVYRSAIRNGEEIWCYIPSKRIRSMLEEWIGEDEIRENVNEGQ